MARQYTTPILIDPMTGASEPLTPLGFGSGAHAMSEAEIQALVHAYPDVLPIREIDPTFVGPISICRELSTPAGPIDNFMVTPAGFPIIVECKLWRNPEGRREVIGQILDYAKELTRWSSADLQREVARQNKSAGNPILNKVRDAGHEVDEAEFNDALSLNLKRGRFLLLIVGDGIREGVEAITEYVQAHAGLHFSLGLIELPIFQLSDGRRLACPRVLVRTALITREVISVPASHKVLDPSNAFDDAQDREWGELVDERQRFWSEFLSELHLDDPEQPIPRPSRQGYVSFMLPAPEGSCWLTVYRDLKRNEVGITLSSAQGYIGGRVADVILEDWDEIGPLCGGSARPTLIRGRMRINENRVFSDLSSVPQRQEAFAWLRERVNALVNVLRPRVRSLVSDFQAGAGD